MKQEESLPVSPYQPEPMRPYYTKRELISELLWIQEFLEELGLVEDTFTHDIYEGVTNAEYCLKYAASIDKMLSTLDPDTYEPDLKQFIPKVEFEEVYK